MFLTFAVWMFISTTNREDKLHKKLNIEYPTLLTKDFVNDKIESNYYPYNWRGKKYHQYITFVSGEKKGIDIKTGITSKDIYFGDIVKKGVILKKNAGSDTIIVVTNNDTIKFLTQEDF